MAKVKKFEEIQSWKKARSLTQEVYAETLTGPFSRDFGLRDQMRRAAVSILSNIAEGFERGGDKEFLQFLAIAKGSAGELRAQLYVALPLARTVRCSDMRGNRSQSVDLGFHEIPETVDLAVTNIDSSFKPRSGTLDSGPWTLDTDLNAN